VNICASLKAEIYGIPEISLNRDLEENFKDSILRPGSSLKYSYATVSNEKNYGIRFQATKFFGSDKSLLDAAFFLVLKDIMNKIQADEIDQLAFRVFIQMQSTFINSNENKGPYLVFILEKFPKRLVGFFEPDETI
jgi:hypothetical protein